MRVLVRMEIKKHLKFIKESFIVYFKTLTEYKGNMYLAFVLDTAWVISSFIFFSVLLNTVGSDIFFLSFSDMMLFSILSGLCFSAFGFLFWKEPFKDFLNKGNMNVLITKPINIWINYLFRDLNPGSFIFSMFEFLFAISIIIYFKIQLFNLLFGALIFMSIAFFTLTLFLMVYSFDFHFRGVGQILSNFVFFGNMQFERFPFALFQNSFIKFFLFGFPAIFSSSLLVPIIRNYPIWNLELQLFILYGLILIFTIIIYINWKIGIKNYEAYG